jgi:chromodomain-helicase-DNA-binding protein 7
MAAHGYQHRVLMTGTPLQNNTSELWSLLNFIEPAKFPDAEKFAARFGNIQTTEQVDALQKRIAPHLLRRVKEDVAKDIPPKEETIIDVELTTMQKQYYRAIFEHNHGFLMQTLKGSGMPKLMNIQVGNCVCVYVCVYLCVYLCVYMCVCVCFVPLGS